MGQVAIAGAVDAVPVEGLDTSGVPRPAAATASWRRLARPLYVALVVATGLITICTSALALHGWSQWRNPALWMLVVLAGISELRQIVVWRGHERVAISTSTIFVFAVMLGYEVAIAVLVHITFNVVAESLARNRLYKIAFNAGMIALLTAVPGWVLIALGPLRDGAPSSLQPSTSRRWRWPRSAASSSTRWCWRSTSRSPTGNDVVRQLAKDLAFHGLTQAHPLQPGARGVGDGRVPALDRPPPGRPARRRVEGHAGEGREQIPPPPRQAHDAPEPVVAPGPTHRGPWVACGRRRPRAAADRPRPLQGGQRHPRAPRRRPAAAADRPRLRPALRDRRHRRPARRRRVRGAAAERPTSTGRAVAGADRRPSLEEPFDFDGRRPSRSRPASASRMFPSTAPTSTTLLQRADIAMYVAKAHAHGRRASTTPSDDRTAASGSRCSASCAARSRRPARRSTTSRRSTCDRRGRRRRGARALAAPRARPAPARTSSCRSPSRPA